jgi:tyrosine-protein phosphatase YwqE
MIASDAHNSDNWAPMLGRAVEKTGKIVGEGKAAAMVNEIPQAILDNPAVPDYGDPIYAQKRGRWRIHI